MRPLWIGIVMSLLTTGCLDFDSASRTFCEQVSCAAGCCTGYSCQANRCVANLTAPGVAISGVPLANETTHSTTTNLSFSLVPKNLPSSFSFECELSPAKTFTPCSALVTSGLLEGVHTLQVRAVDRFGTVGETTTYSWTVAPLSTTIADIRILPIAEGTRVELAGFATRVSALTHDRFWVQEDVVANSGITVRPRAYDPADPNLAPGRSLSIVGTVAQVSFNTTLVDATYTPGFLMEPYGAKDSFRDSIDLLLEENEGMLVSMGGQASLCSPTFDLCIQSCESRMPLIYATDGTPTGVPRDVTIFAFLGIVEGVGAGQYDYTYYVTEADANADECASL